MLTVSAVYVLRGGQPELPRPFRTPGYPIVPAIYLAGTALLTAGVFYERPVVSSIGLVFGNPHCLAAQSVEECGTHRR